MELWSEIDSIDISHFLQFADLLRECGNTDVLMNQIITGIKFYRYNKSVEVDRSVLYSRIAELLVSMDNDSYEQSCDFMQSHWRDPAVHNSSYLLAINVVILVLKSIKIASDVMILCGMQPISSLGISKFPLRFTECAEALHSVVFLNLENQFAAVAVLRAKCSKCLNDLKNAFSLCFRHKVACKAMDIHEFYVAYLLGVRKHQEVDKVYVCYHHP
jgi:hypothetical protein